MRRSLLVLSLLGLVPCSQALAQDPDGKASTTGDLTAPPANQGGAGGPTMTSDLNMTLVRQWHRAAGVEYNDIWGWTAPNGREFAYVGERAGLWFVETTDPQNIRQVGWWSAPYSIWRDFANLGPYVYSVSEHHRGIRIIDMSNPDVPVDLGYVETSAIANTHNITADPATGYLYLSGTNQGLMIYDASQNPTAPQLVGTWYPGRTYTHDCCVLRGRAYLSNGSSYVARIMDASNPGNLVEIGRCDTPGGYDHNVWVSDDDQLLCVTDEIARGSVTPHMTVWDISNPRAPARRGDYDLGSRSIVHNVFILGRTAYMSHYIDGVHVVDITNPAQPTRVASYDTSTVSSGYNGCWGVHPFAENGLVYASDMQNGLFVWQIDCGHMNRFGNGTPGAGGAVPHAKFADATPRVGASGLRLLVDGLAPNARGLLVLSTAEASGTVLGFDLHVDLSFAMTLDFTADPTGAASIALPVPNHPGLANGRIYMQIVAADAGAPAGWSASRGMWVGICP
ncbi:MAG: choice-of-anchor B family protein [Planctomycetes bacterium]|nr:choice-of-anchor B family protein [Planctomycetota bacterium]